VNDTRWRSIVIGTDCQLSCSEGQMLVRTSDKREELIPLFDVQTVIVATCHVSLTASLLYELQKQDIRMVFCDESQLPYGEVVPYSANNLSAGRLREQIAWRKIDCSRIWKRIISLKLQMQHSLLLRLGVDFQEEKFQKYIATIKSGDHSNREGTSARMYFVALFGKEFSRRNPSNTNSALNYGYAVLASAVTRSIVAHGYNPSLGIHHRGETNPLNLTYDFIEPFRPFVDRIAFEYCGKELNRELKRELIDVTNTEVRYNLKKITVLSAIDQFVLAMTEALKSREVPQIEMDFEL